MMRYIPLFVVLAVILAACASIGNPSGGPRDEDPPIFVRANPAPGAVNVSKSKIEIDFNEIINVKDAFTKVVVSPPSKSVPRVSSLGRKVSVEFRDSLLPNTTYTISFADAIEDNNEGNKLQGFSYSFSTGPTLDTLQISGMVLSADALEPQQGMLVGLYSSEALADTTLEKTPFERIAKTDDRGRFTIDGLSPGSYRLFALDDLDNDYKRANPEESMAFYEFDISPSSERGMASDTVFNLLTGAVDTVIERERTIFLPNDILLRSFTSDKRQQFLKDYERMDTTRLRMIFNAPSDSLPSLSLPHIEGYKDWAILERSEHNDTLVYWILPPTIVSTDSLWVAVDYLRTDSTMKLSATTDTLRFFYDRPSPSKKRDKKKGEAVAADTLPPVIPPLKMSVQGSSSQEVYLPIGLEFDTPLVRLDTSAFHLEQMIDSVWTPVEKEWSLRQTRPGNPRHFTISYPWDYATEYRLTGDTLSAEGIYGLVTTPFEHKFKTKGEEEYCSLSFTITNFVDTVPAFVELLNGSDAVVRREPVVNGSVLFKHLAPGKYFARIFEDFNGDGKFTTGDYDSIRQPDLAYYYPKAINIKKNWEKTETWSVFDIPVDLMKPENLKKNKPAAGKNQRNKKTEDSGGDDEDDDIFDPTRNPFDPNDRRNNRQNGSTRRR